MEVVEAFAEIDAPPSVVWDVLLDFEAYPEWNPFVRSIAGAPVKDERLTVRIEPPGSRGWTFRPTVLVAEENERLAWRGRLLLPFLFDGYHEFHLEEIDDDRTRVLQRETFRGALVSVLLDEDRLERGFDAMNEALAERAEARSRAAN